MEIVSWLVFTGMSSLVATGKLRQRVPRALPKLQIIRRARGQGKPSVYGSSIRLICPTPPCTVRRIVAGVFPQGLLGDFPSLLRQPWPAAAACPPETPTPQPTFLGTRVV